MFKRGKTPIGSVKEVTANADGVTFKMEPITPVSNEEKNEEKWVWVEGYKGTDRNMCCRGFQYELNKQFDMPDGQEARICESGFHFCERLANVFEYYSLKDNNRFFKVRGLVNRNNDTWPSITVNAAGRIVPVDKLAAKSIVFLEELSTDDIIKILGYGESFTESDKLWLRMHGYESCKQVMNIRELGQYGYCEKLSEYFAKNKLYDLAVALGSQPGLSMDTKVSLILNQRS